MGSRRAMEIGAHLPLIPFSEGAPSPAGLRAYAAAASRLGYRWLSANDHLVFRRPWLDGLTALAAVIDVSGDLGLATTICLPAVRGPAQAAKAFAALDILSDGRFVAGLGPGSSERDYVVGGVPVEDRFARFEEAVQGRPGAARPGRRALHRPLLLDRRRHARAAPRASRTAAHLAGRLGWLTRAAARGGARRRLARLRLQHHAGAFGASWARVREHVAARGADPDRFDNGIATLWAYVTEDRAAADRVLADVLSPLLGRPVESLRELSLPIGPAEVCAERLQRLRGRGGPAGCSSGRSGTSCASSSCSPSGWCRTSRATAPPGSTHCRRNRDQVGAAVLVLAAIVAAARPRPAAAAGPLPDCAPGTATPRRRPRPSAGQPGEASPAGLVAGRFFTIEYDDPEGTPDRRRASRQRIGPAGPARESMAAPQGRVPCAGPSAGAIPRVVTARYS